MNGHRNQFHGATSYIGLRNEGGTCYMNALFQSLFAIDEFRRIIFNAPVDVNDINHSFVFDLQFIFYLMQSHKMSDIRTEAFINHFGWEQMTTMRQQDIHEFSRLLINKLNDHLRNTQLENAIRNLFIGKTRTTTKRQGSVSSTEEEFIDLQLYIESSGRIEDAFRSLVTYQDIKNYGHDKCDAKQKREFINLPSILTIQLMRFQFNSETEVADKNNKRFEFGPNLDLSEYSAGSEYLLHSVLVHSGTMNGGHYTAYVNPRCYGHWYKFDDQNVTESTPREAIGDNFGRLGNTSAYILIYVKKSMLSKIFREVPIQSIPIAGLMEAKIEEIRLKASRNQRMRVQSNLPRTFEPIVSSTMATRNTFNAAPFGPRAKSKPISKSKPTSKSNPISKSKSRSKPRSKSKADILYCISNNRINVEFKSINTSQVRLRRPWNKSGTFEGLVDLLAEELIRKKNELKFYNANKQEIDYKILSLRIIEYINAFHLNDNITDTITMFYGVISASKQN